MMKKMAERLGIGVLVMAICIWAMPGTSQAERKIIILGTAPAGSASFPFMVGVATIVNKLLPQFALSPQETGGSVANIRLLDEGKIQLSGFSSMVATDAVEGKPPFKEKRKVQALFTMYQQRYVYFARQGSGVKSWSEVAGKKVCVGTPAGSTRIVGDLIAKTMGVADKAKILYLRTGAMVNALQDGTIDVGNGMATGGSLAPWADEIMATVKTNIFGVPEDVVREMMKKNKGLFLAKFPAGYFKGYPALTTVADALVAGASPTMDEETAYLITKAVQEHLKELSSYSPAARGAKPEDALNGVPPNVSFHPGAIRYYKEKGLMK
jgi:TRAP transporter TAXI family solute receptor